MAIIIISSDAREIEESIAEKVVAAMNFKWLNRRILDDVAAKHGIDPDKLSDAMETTPSLFNRLSSKQWRYYLACIEAEVLDRLLGDNIVCSGLAAHLYVVGVSHAMKVRILSGRNKQIKGCADKSGTSLQETGKDRAGELQKRKKWSLAAYDYDETDLSRYDLVINLDQIDPVEAVKTISGAAEYRKFQVMTYSKKCLSDLALAAKVDRILLKSMADVKVQARDGSVVVLTKASNRQRRKKIETIKELAGNVEGVRYVEVHVQKNILGAAQSPF